MADKSSGLLPMRILIALCLFGPVGAPATASDSGHRTRLASVRHFQRMAETVTIGRHASFPRILFVIDRRGKAPKVHFASPKRYPFHIDFIQQTYLSTQSLEEINRVSYSAPDRRFLLGSIVHYPVLGRYGVEFWEGDVLDPALVTLTMRELGRAFPVPLAFKPNSQPQIAVAAAMPGLSVINPDAVFASRPVLGLNDGRAVGRLRIVPRLTATTQLGRADIVILGEAPLQLSPVAGLLTAEPSSPLSHVNLLAKSWRVPNAYQQGALTRHAALDGEMVVLEVKDDAVSIRRATESETAGATRHHTTILRLPVADTNFTGLPALTDQHAADVIRTGAKAANLGEVARRAAGTRYPGFAVPAGFSIPFHYYERFVRETGLAPRIAALLADPAVRSDPAHRASALAALRGAFDAAPIPPDMLALFQQRRATVTGTDGVFVRSSTNSEDLKGFNGAGLYSSVPNVKDEATAFAAAIRTVWGSIWNDRAFEAREAAGVDHAGVKAAVLVQRGVNASAAGVLITENPFNPQERNAVYINAKRGLGIRVVEGRRVAEQLLYRPEPEAIQLLTRSSDDAMLVFDAAGGVREVPVEPGRVVLTDAVARHLAQVGIEIEDWFNGVPQDIEWVMEGDTLHIVQSRPYLRGN